MTNSTPQPLVIVIPAPYASTHVPGKPPPHWGRGGHQPNTVKVVLATNGDALYFSRATIPHTRYGDDVARYLKHMGQGSNAMVQNLTLTWLASQINGSQNNAK